MFLLVIRIFNQSGDRSPISLTNLKIVADADAEAADDDEDSELPEGESPSSEGADNQELVSAKEDEVLCQSCFTLVPQKAIDEEGACPNCGAEM